MWPFKTTLSVLSLGALLLLPRMAPALKNLRSLDPHNLPAVWNFPLDRIVPATARAGASEAALDQLRTTRLAALAPTNLADPNHELDHYYAALLRGGTTRVVHYGDSPTTADLITADARTLLQQQFGDSGTGFILIARPWAWYNHRGVDLDASRWKIDIGGATELKDGMYGLGGASFRGGAGTEARWTLKDGHHRFAEVSFLGQPDGGEFSFEAEGQPVGSADTQAETRSPGFHTFELPAGSKHFTLKVTRGTVRLYGVEFRKAGPGVLYSSLGINGANVTLVSRAFNGAHWSAILRHYKPDLVVLAYGTNESGFPQFVNTTWGPELKAAVQRVRAALPEASVLLMSPMDRGERGAGGDIETVPALPHLVEVETAVAKETGVAFFNTFQAMGGPGTMARWYNGEPRLVGADYIHPMPGGAKIVGELLYRAMRDGFQDYRLRQLKDTITEEAQPKEAQPKEVQKSDARK